MNTNPDPEHRDSEPLDELDRDIRAALATTGDVIPTTVDAVAAASKNLADNPVPLPAHLRDASAVLSRSLPERGSAVPKNVVPFASAYDEAVQADLARAARKGGEISAETEQKMRRARVRAQQQKQNI
jgi:hypothetical protein